MVNHWIWALTTYKDKIAYGGLFREDKYYNGDYLLKYYDMETGEKGVLDVVEENLYGSKDGGIISLLPYKEGIVYVGVIGALRGWPKYPKYIMRYYDLKTGERKILNVVNTEIRAITPYKEGIVYMGGFIENKGFALNYIEIK